MQRSFWDGRLKVEIDGWGGVHFHFEEVDDPPISLSPRLMDRVEEQRKKAVAESEENNEMD